MTIFRSYVKAPEGRKNAGFQGSLAHWTDDFDRDWGWIQENGSLTWVQHEDVHEENLDVQGFIGV